MKHFFVFSEKKIICNICLSMMGILKRSYQSCSVQYHSLMVFNSTLYITSNNIHLHSCLGEKYNRAFGHLR